MDLASLKKINDENIGAAGPRYTPIVDKNAPNLHITSLLSAIEALALTKKYQNYIFQLKEDLSESWKKSSKITNGFFTSKSPNNLIYLLDSLKKQKAGKSESTL